MDLFKFSPNSWYFFLIKKKRGNDFFFFVIKESIDTRTNDGVEPNNEHETMSSGTYTQHNYTISNSISVSGGTPIGTTQPTSTATATTTTTTTGNNNGNMRNLPTVMQEVGQGNTPTYVGLKPESEKPKIAMGVDPKAFFNLHSSRTSKIHFSMDDEVHFESDKDNDSAGSIPKTKLQFPRDSEDDFSVDHANK
ncbi:hypothetical protein RFI_31777, partial [Reticulomyxa filosa]